MKIVNLIHMGDEVKNLDELSEEERREIGRRLNEQSLRALGYKRSDEIKASEKETAQKRAVI